MTDSFNALAKRVVDALKTVPGIDAQVGAAAALGEMMGRYRRVKAAICPEPEKRTDDEGEHWLDHSPYYNLMGAEIDIKRKWEDADEVCLRTINRVLVQLSAAKDALQEGEANCE